MTGPVGTLRTDVKATASLEVTNEEEQESTAGCRIDGWSLNAYRSGNANNAANRSVDGAAGVISRAGGRHTERAPCSNGDQNNRVVTVKDSTQQRAEQRRS